MRAGPSTILGEDKFAQTAHISEILRVKRAEFSTSLQLRRRYLQFVLLTVTTPGLVGQQGQNKPVETTLTHTFPVVTSDSVPACDPNSPVQTLTGTVTDATGAAVLNAHVVLRCGSLTETLQTSRDGHWSIILPASHSAVHIASHGFTDASLTLYPGDFVRSFDVVLHVTSENQSVEVLGTPDYVASTNTSGT